jgi:hypothetical protein
MSPVFRASPKAFLDAPRREWQFDTFAWLLRACGGYPRFLDTLLVLPTEEHFPDHGLSGHAAAAAVFRRARDHAGMADWPCMVEPRPADADVRRIAADGLRIIYYDPSDHVGQHGLTRTVAYFGHELSRYLVDHIEEPPPGGEELVGPAVDLAAVFMGFGVFMANSCATGADWELNEGELIHALALFCLLRRIETDDVDPHLNPHVRKYLRLAARDLARHGSGLQRLRSVFPVVLDSSRAHPAQGR